MGCSRIMTTNYLDPDLVSNSYVSSEQTAFPVSNLYNAQRRSKVWRSNGFWEVTTSNNTIIFNESAGVDLTATLTVDDYTSTTSFLAAVKTALDAAGVSTYTVSQDSTTKKIKIVSNGVGGTGIFTIKWTDPDSAGFAALTGFDTSADDTGSLTYMADELKIHSSEWVKWDFGISTNPTSFILIGPRNSPIKISPTAVLKLQGNETNVWDDPSFETTLTYDDEVISLFNEDGFHTEALRYWRLYIEDKSNGNGYVEIGSLFLGIYFQATRGAISFPLTGNYVDRSLTSFSEGGQTFSDVRQKTEILSFEWRLLTKSEKEEIDDIFNNNGISYPFFVQLDPDLAFSSRSAKYIRFVKFDSAPVYILETANNYTCQMVLREEL